MSEQCSRPPRAVRWAGALAVGVLAAALGPVGERLPMCNEPTTEQVVALANATPGFKARTGDEPVDRPSLGGVHTITHDATDPWATVVVDLDGATVQGSFRMEVACDPASCASGANQATVPGWFQLELSPLGGYRQGEDPQGWSGRFSLRLDDPDTENPRWDLSVWGVAEIWDPNVALPPEPG